MVAAIPGGDGVLGVLAVGWSATRPCDTADETFLASVAATLAARARREDAERSLAETNRLLHEAFDRAPIGKAIVSLTGEVLLANSALLTLFGYQRSEVAGLDIRTLIDAADVAAGAALFQRLVTGDLDQATLELTYLRADGGRVLGSTTVTLIRDQLGVPTRLLAQIQDVTLEREAQRRLAFQASLLDQVQHAVIATDLEGRVTYWNHSAESMYGWERDEVMGKQVLHLTVPPEVEDRAAEIMGVVLQQGRWGGEFEVLRRDQSRFPALVTNSLLTGIDGQPIGVVGVSTDLTDLKAAHAQARQRDLLARSVLDSVEFPAAVVDATGVILAVNRAWEAATLAGGGDPAATGVGVNYLEVGERAAQVDATAEEAVAGLRAVLAGEAEQFQLEYPCPTPEELRWFRMEVSPFADRSGAVILHTDITALRRAVDRAEALVRSKDELIASISHELRTPLAAVLGFSDLLLTVDAVRPEERQELLGTIAREARDMAAIVEDLLVAARADIGVLAVRKERVRLEEEVRRVVAALQIPAGVDLQITGSCPDALADAARVRQVIRNLLTNAFRYGGPQVEVVLGSEDHQAVIEVRDDGEGLPPDQWESIFQPYYRAHHVAGTTGAIGLGLSVARILSRLMNGDLTYARRRHSVFHLTLPLST